MRIMVDANIIISAGLFPKSAVGEVLAHIVKNHELILCQYTLDELRMVFKKKFPDRIEYYDKFIKELKYELFDMQIINYEKYPRVRDVCDIPVLAYAIESKAKMLITGDKDFEDITIETPEIIRPREYIEKYMK